MLKATLFVVALFTLGTISPACGDTYVTNVTPTETDTDTDSSGGQTSGQDPETDGNPGTSEDSGGGTGGGGSSTGSGGPITASGSSGGASSTGSTGSTGGPACNEAGYQQCINDAGGKFSNCGGGSGPCTDPALNQCEDAQCQQHCKVEAHKEYILCMEYFPGCGNDTTQAVLECNISCYEQAETCLDTIAWSCTPDDYNACLTGMSTCTNTC